MMNHAKKLAGISALLVIAGSLGAVELPPPENPPAPDDAAVQAQSQVDVEVDVEEQAADPPKVPAAMPEVGAVQAYLGVGGTEVPELLSTHLGLKIGEGVVVRTLDPEGPAAGMGVQENDVLLRIAGTAVGTQDELRDAIQAHGAGDEVELDLIQEGKPLKKTVKLGERPAMPGAVAPQMVPMLEGLPEGQAKRVREAIEQNLRALEGLKMPELEQQAPEAMKQLEKRMELMFRGLGEKDGGIQFMGSSTVRLQDAQGSVEMESKDGSKQMRVRDNDGKVEWEGPWDTEQDKAAAPDNIRERIDRLNLDVIDDVENGGLRLQLRGGVGGLELDMEE